MTPLAALLELVLPRRCVGCGVVGAGLCDACLPLAVLRQLMPFGVTVVSAGPYDTALRAALLRYKERGRRDLAPPLGQLLGRSVAALLDGARAVGAPADGAPADGALLDGARAEGAVLVPVPSRRAAVTARGGDHLLRLARHAGVGCGVGVEQALRLARPTADSAGLDAAARFANSGGSMVARRPGFGRKARGGGCSAGRVAVVVDDIVTTGATLREACRALEAADWQVLGAAVVAATPLTRGRSRRSAPAIPGAA